MVNYMVMGMLARRGQDDVSIHAENISDRPATRNQSGLLGWLLVTY